MPEPWDWDSPERTAAGRRELLAEIDALAALQLGLTIDELVAIYTTQFSVLHHKYEKVQVYDAKGRLVPNDVMRLEKVKKNTGRLSRQARMWLHPQSRKAYTFRYPFVTYDREADMREAYELFKKLGE